MIQPKFIYDCSPRLCSCAFQVHPVPDQETWKASVISFEGKASTWLTGALLSMVFDHVGVGIGAFASKTTVA